MRKALWRQENDWQPSMLLVFAAGTNTEDFLRNLVCVCAFKLNSSRIWPSFSNQFWSLQVPEHGLDVDDGLGVRHVVLLSAHCALLVHNHQIVCVYYATLEQVVQAGVSRKQRIYTQKMSIAPY